MILQDPDFVSSTASAHLAWAPYQGSRFRAYHVVRGEALREPAIVKQIIDLDADGKAGLRAKYELQFDIREVIALANKRDIPGALKALDALFAKHKPSGEAAQGLYLMKSQLCFMKGDRKQAKAMLYKGINISPDTRTAARAKGILMRMFNERYKAPEGDK